MGVTKFPYGVGVDDDNKLESTGLTIGGVALTATATEINAIADGSASYVAIPDAATYTVLAANSGKVHILPNLTADITITLPTAAAGLRYEFISKAVAADAQDWIIDTGSDTNFYLGGITKLDTGAGTNELEVPDGNSNSKMSILTPTPGTLVRLLCDGTNWIIMGIVQSDTADAVTWADQ